jgi:alginate O-acetyltransferase complex protein AlgI
MLFTSTSYLVFLPVVLLLYYWLRPAARRYMLLLASWLFYAAYNPWFMWVILATTSVDWVAGAQIDQTDSPRRRALWLGASITSNLGLLAYFKYSGFLLENLGVHGHAIGLQHWAWRAGLPLGISFHTFQGISYVVDVYRRHIQPVRSFTEFALFVSFFPQLVAGPIVRAPEFIPQIDCRSEADALERRQGVGLIMYGMFKKVYVADVMASWVNDAYADPSRFSGFGLLCATLAFTVQIYCDFSGYSDIAIGSAQLFGIRLPTNFDSPYLAMSIREFWQRWHMTLSRWLRDYLYIPLGGNQRGTGRTYVNLMITMVLGGLWHGAGWNWVVWGAIQGIVMSVERFTGLDRAPNGGVARFGRWLVTFVIVVVSWVFFRARSVSQAVLVIERILDWSPGHIATDRSVATYASVALIAVLVAGRMRTRKRWIAWVAQRQTTVRWLAYACVVALALTFSGAVKQEFIYFAF